MTWSAGSPLREFTGWVAMLLFSFLNLRGNRVKTRVRHDNSFADFHFVENNKDNDMYLKMK